MSAKTNDDNDYAIETTLMRAEVGLSPDQSITVAPSQTLRRRLLGTLALSRTGRLERVTAAADALRRDFPSNTIVQKYGLPLIRRTFEDWRTWSRVMPVPPRRIFRKCWSGAA